MDLYNRVYRQQENTSRSLNYQNIHTDLLFQDLQITRSDGYPTLYPHIPKWDELWGEMQGGAGGSGALGGDESDYPFQSQFFLCLKLLKNIFIFICF